jgi:hypothetical protein
VEKRRWGTHGVQNTHKLRVIFKSHLEGGGGGFARIPPYVLVMKFHLHCQNLKYPPPPG